MSLEILDTEWVFEHTTNTNAYFCQILNFLNIYFIYLKGRVTERQRKKSLTSKVAATKPWARNSIWVCYMGGRCPNTWTIFYCFPHVLVESWIRSREAGTWTGAPIWDSDTTYRDLTCATTLVSKVKFLIRKSKP